MADDPHSTKPQTGMRPLFRLLAAVVGVVSLVSFSIIVGLYFLFHRLSDLANATLTLVWSLFWLYLALTGKLPLSQRVSHKENAATPPHPLAPGQ